MSEYLRGVGAYHKALEAAKKAPISPDKAMPMAILGKGDDIKITGLNPPFVEAIDHVVKEEVSRLRKSDKKVYNALAVNGSGTPEGTDLVGLAETLNTVEMQLTKITVVRDKFIEAYKQILSMPL